MSIASESGAQRYDDDEKSSVVASQEQFSFNLFLKVNTIASVRFRHDQAMGS